MRLRDANTYTGDHTKPAETEVSVLIGTETYRFAVLCTRETLSSLTQDDWGESRSNLQRDMDAKVRELLLGGVYFDTEAPAALRWFARKTMRQHIYAALRKRQNAAGNLKFQVDPLLKGKEYEVHE